MSAVVVLMTPRGRAPLSEAARAFLSAVASAAEALPIRDPERLYHAALEAATVRLRAHMLPALTDDDGAALTLRFNEVFEDKLFTAREVVAHLCAMAQEGASRG